jgi:hypothetical protein
VFGLIQTTLVIPAKHGEAMREPESSKHGAQRILSANGVYWIPASAGMTSVSMADRRNHVSIT